MKTQANIPTGLVETKQVAEILGITVEAVRKNTKLGLIPCIQINSRLRRYDLAAVMAHLTIPAKSKP